MINIAVGDNGVDYLRKGISEWRMSFEKMHDENQIWKRSKNNYIMQRGLWWNFHCRTTGYGKDDLEVYI
jgi:hypothetical protein